jgi:protein-S-isoprenylcysteine O-methyltransferase Ste14
MEAFTMNNLPDYGLWQLVIINSVIMIGFLLQWPTIPTLLMFPILVLLYFRLARREKMEALARFGELYAQYAENIPRFVPRIRWV